MTGDHNDDLDADLEWVEDREEWERDIGDAHRRLCEGLARFRGLAPTQEVRAAAVRLRANLGSKQYPFPELARAFAQSGGPPQDDAELPIRSVAATVAPLSQIDGEEATDSGDEQVAFDEERLPLDMGTEELDLEDWLALVTAALTQGRSAWLDPDALVRDGGLDPESDDGWIKEGAFVRAISLWEDLGMLDGGRVTKVGRWVLPRALARAWERDFDHPE